MLLRIALRKTTLRFTALTTALAIVIAPTLALAQENKGPPILRDTESEQLLRDYTRPILRAAGRSAVRAGYRESIDRRLSRACARMRGPWETGRR